MTGQGDNKNQLRSTAEEAERFLQSLDDEPEQTTTPRLQESPASAEGTIPSEVVDVPAGSTSVGSDSDSAHPVLVALIILILLSPLVLLLLWQIAKQPSAESPAPAIAPPASERVNESERSTTIEPLPTQKQPASQPLGLTQQQARAIVEKWLQVKSQIFAPPFNTALADQVVAEGPLWTDLTKPDGSIQWLKTNNSYYTYSTIKVNRVIRFVPSASMPSIAVSVTEVSTLNSPKGNETSTNTKNWNYTLKKESGRWKIWDYRKQ